MAIAGGSCKLWTLNGGTILSQIYRESQVCHLEIIRRISEDGNKGHCRFVTNGLLNLSNPRLHMLTAIVHPMRILPYHAPTLPCLTNKDQFYHYMDVAPEIRFHNRGMPEFRNHGESQWLHKAVSDQVFCIELCCPHMYFGWREYISKTDFFEEFCPDSFTEISIFSKPEWAILSYCLKARLNLDAGKFVQAKKFCRKVDMTVLAMEDSWITGVYYYTRILLLLQRFKMTKTKDERDTILGEALPLFIRSRAGFVKDSDYNLSLKYYLIAIEILELNTELYRLLLNTTLEDLQTYHEKAVVLERKFLVKLKSLSAIQEQSKVLLNYESAYWYNTLQGIHGCIEKNLKLLSAPPRSEEELADLQTGAMRYISVLIKHPSYEQGAKESKTGLFIDITKAIQKPDDQSRTIRLNSAMEVVSEREISSGLSGDSASLSDLPSGNSAGNSSVSESDYV